MEQISQKPIRPNNYLALAIISTIMCCMPLGIVSIVYAAKVNTEYDSGNFQDAESSSKSAKNWGIASLVSGVLVYVGVLLLYGVALMAAIANG